MEQLEERLRSWQPRRPSPKIKRRLFGEAVRQHTAEWSLRWAATAAACLLLTLTIFKQDSEFAHGTPGREPLMGLISSNLSSTNILPGNHSPVRGVNAPTSFEWTNLSGFTSSVSPFSPGRVN
jgi:hypothetical protein